jgi:hypothetical protein
VPEEGVLPGATLDAIREMPLQITARVDDDTVLYAYAPGEGTRWEVIEGQQWRAAGLVVSDGTTTWRYETNENVFIIDEWSGSTDPAPQELHFDFWRELCATQGGVAVAVDAIIGRSAHRVVCDGVNGPRTLWIDTETGLVLKVESGPGVLLASGFGSPWPAAIEVLTLEFAPVFAEGFFTGTAPEGAEIHYLEPEFQDPLRIDGAPDADRESFDPAILEKGVAGNIDAASVTLLDGSTMEIGRSVERDRYLALVILYAYLMDADPESGAVEAQWLFAVEEAYQTWTSHLDFLVVGTAGSDPGTLAILGERFGLSIPLAVDSSSGPGSNSLWGIVERPAFILFDPEGGVVGSFCACDTADPGGGMNLLLSNTFGGLPRAESESVDAGDQLASEALAAIPLADLSGTWTSFGKAEGSPGDCITGLFTDPGGVVWATGACGVSRFEDGAWVEVISDEVFGEIQFHAGAVFPVSDTRGMLEFDGTEWVPISYPPGGFTTVDADGVFWQSGEGGLRSFDGGTVTEYPEIEFSVDVAAHSDGTIWVMQEDSLADYDGSSWLVHQPEDFQLFPYWIKIAPDGALWHHADTGLGRYDGAGEWERFPFIDSPDDLAFAPDGTVWVADADNGAFCYDGSNWTRYTTEHGLVSNNLTAVTVAGDGSIWFGSLESGLVHFQPD